ncbi:MAG TPA: hypothetical protein VK797_08815 [Tepidisphaeraceae bacterium]|jgi:hypothetical protein|nr:hypothetical protein [Tepidisphaeraceae bacterium]
MRRKHDSDKIVLDYSSEAEEQKAEEQREAERRKAVGDYNESTFGERHPFGSPFLRLGVFAVIISLMIFLLPKPIGRPLALITTIAFVIWQRVRYG